MRFAPSFSNGRRFLMRPAKQERASAFAFPSASILLATDGSDSADGAVAMAARLVQLRQARLQVVTVVEPVGVDAVAGIIGLEERQLSTMDPAEEQRRVVRQQLARFVDAADTIDVAAPLGAPAPAIASMAEMVGPALIMLGLRRHSLLDRVFREETTLQVMRRVSVPVLAVQSIVADLPKRAVVGVDFSRSSLHAAYGALSLLADDATLYLVHVEPRSREGDGRTGEDPLLGAALPAGFARFRNLLRASARTRVEQVILEGENFRELDDFAARVGAQLVALGSIHRDDAVPRGGRLREAFVRSACCSLLVGPPAPRVGIMDD